MELVWQTTVRNQGVIPASDAAGSAIPLDQRIEHAACQPKRARFLNFFELRAPETKKAASGRRLSPVF
jgi:hypothetical protein